jgi:hypothetical protein
VDAEMGVGGDQQPVQVHLLDDRDARRGQAPDRRRALEDRAVRPFVLLARMQLHHDVHVRQRAVHQPGEADRVMDTPIHRAP